MKFVLVLLCLAIVASTSAVSPPVIAVSAGWGWTPNIPIGAGPWGGWGLPAWGWAGAPWGNWGGWGWGSGRSYAHRADGYGWGGPRGVWGRWSRLG